MHRRGVRIALVVLLLAVGSSAGLALWDLDRRIATLDASAAQVDGALERMLVAAAGLTQAQQAYLAVGRPPRETFEQTNRLVHQLRTDTAGLVLRARSSGAPPRLSALDHTLARFVDVDAAVRSSLLLDDERRATHIIYGDAAEIAGRMREEIDGLRAAERAAAAAAQGRLERWQTLVLGGAALLWLFGLFALVPRAAPPAAAPAAAGPRSGAAEPLRPEAPAALDLLAAADVCTAISRVTSSEALPDVLARAAAVLDATGLVVWMGAGDALFAVAAHGYDRRILGRLGPIPRTADNAAAAAWRTGELRTVSPDSVSNGAIVAPLLGPAACIGVLAIEVRHHKDADPAVQAVAMMFAAQLATLLGTWPAAGASGEREDPSDAPDSSLPADEAPLQARG